ncbi:MAG TPA: antitoxin Xre/MbcA/ParS toxin-binding domain-containing protein [Opitutaceae bacterium]|jgi:putative toxin-antitoxin system antitoxin component (TIGR02293 family)
MTRLQSITADPAEAEKNILAGLHWSEAEQLAEFLEVPVTRLGEILQIPPATMARRKTSGHFSTAESEKIVRLARLYFLAEQATGSPAGARSWLKRPQFGLNGRVPLEAARLEVGARTVETLLGRIHHGVLA